MRSCDTPKKHEDLEAIFKTLVCAGNKILDKYETKGWAADRSFWVFDLNAGPGIYPDGLEGSPIILLKILARFTERPCKIVLIENNSEVPGTYETLCRNIKRFRWPERIQIHPILGDQEKVLPLFYPNTRYKRFGLVFQDFSGAPRFSPLIQLSHVACYSKTDMLINCNETQIKRNLGLCQNPKYHVTKETRLPEEAIKDIDKQYWQVCGPLGRWRWKMFLGTNWPAIASFKPLGFLPLNGR